MAWVPSRAESYSVQTRTGPWTGSDRTGPDRTEAIRSGPRSKAMSYSVLGPVPVWTGGPVDQTGGPNNIEEGFFFFNLLYVARSCHEARHNRAKTLPRRPVHSKSTFQVFNIFYFSTFPLGSSRLLVLHFSFTESPLLRFKPSTSLHAFSCSRAPVLRARPSTPVADTAIQVLSVTPSGLSLSGLSSQSLWLSSVSDPCRSARPATVCPPLRLCACVTVSVA